MACPYAGKICHKDSNFFPYARMCGNIKKRARNGRSLFTFQKDNTKIVWHKKTKRQLSRARSYKYIQQI